MGSAAPARGVGSGVRVRQTVSLSRQPGFWAEVCHAHAGSDSGHRVPASDAYQSRLLEWFRRRTSSREADRGMLSAALDRCRHGRTLDRVRRLLVPGRSPAIVADGLTSLETLARAP